MGSLNRFDFLIAAGAVGWFFNGGEPTFWLVYGIAWILATLTHFLGQRDCNYIRSNGSPARRTW